MSLAVALALIGSIVGERRACAADSPAAQTDSGDLPTIVVPQRPVHVVPDDDPLPAPPVTLKGRAGQAAASHPAPVAARLPLITAPQSGRDAEADGASLRVHGYIVKLFGVRAALPGDRCAQDATPAPRACVEVARDVLAARISGEISCHTPPGQRTAPPGGVCTDAHGVDLGRLLVTEGLALADTSQSYDYVGAESVARLARQGLWRYR